MNEEETYLKELADAGVDVTDVKETPEEVTPPEEKPTVEQKEEKAEEVPKEKPLVTEPKEQHKRSIYEEYKEKKSELKSEKDAREQAERERDELKAKLDALSNADTPQEKKEASDDLEAFAQEINADPATLRKMQSLFLKDVKASTDEGLAKDLQEFKQWKSENSQVIEKSRFEAEFQSVTPTLKELLPNASDEELQLVKEKVDEISHTKEFHDKDLDYVVFKNKDELSKLVSPKKRGMEQKGRKDVQDEVFDFNPDADYSKMSMKERELWEEGYKKFTAGEGIVMDAKGKKLLI